ncbi:MAG TPA: hypothetical protein VHR43_16025, partial [Gemmatimonadales bacterium]|nr:hypothetical protein [Gemmatimonadales bacterium]
ARSARRIKAVLQTAAQDGLERLKETTTQLKETTTGLVEGVKERIAARQDTGIYQDQGTAGGSADMGLDEGRPA